MPLQIKHAEGITMPIIICDFCHEQITDAKEGSYQFRMPDEGEVINDIFFTHEKCCRAFEKLEPESLWSSVSLECLPIYLGNNLNLNLKQARETVKTMSPA